MATRWSLAERADHHRQRGDPQRRAARASCRGRRPDPAQGGHPHAEDRRDARGKIYLAVGSWQHLRGDLSSHNEVYFPARARFPAGRAERDALIAEVNRILSGDLYKALRSAKQLVAYEQELMDHALRGERVLEGRPGHAVAAGA